MKKFYIHLALLICSIQAFSAYGNDYATGNIKNRSIDVKVTYIFDQADYLPAVHITYKDSQKNAPEDTLQRYFRAMKNGDVSGFYKEWDEASAGEIQAFNLQTQISDKQMQKNWSELMSEKEVYLSKRANYQDFVLIEYVYQDSKSKKTLFSNTAVLVKKDNTWKLTRMVSDDPVVMYWRIVNPQNLQDVRGKVKKTEVVKSQ